MYRRGLGKAITLERMRGGGRGRGRGGGGKRGKVGEEKWISESRGMGELGGKRGDSGGSLKFVVFDG